MTAQATQPATNRGRPSMRDQVAALLVKRPPLTNQQIAARLGCSANTVNEWRRKIAAAGSQA